MTKMTKMTKKKKKNVLSSSSSPSLLPLSPRSHENRALVASPDPELLVEKSPVFVFVFFEIGFFFPSSKVSAGVWRKKKKALVSSPPSLPLPHSPKKKKKNGKRKPKNTKNSTHVSTHPFGLAHDRGIENLSGGTQISAASNSTSTLVSLPAALSTLPRTSR